MQGKSQNTFDSSSQTGCVCHIQLTLPPYPCYAMSTVPTTIFQVAVTESKGFPQVTLPVLSKVDLDLPIANVLQV